MPFRKCVIIFFNVKTQGKKSPWTYSGSPADPGTTLDKVVQDDERHLFSLEKDGIPEILGIGSLKYRTAHQPLPVHIHRDAIELHLCRAGAACFEVSGATHDLLPGNICLVQPGVDHHMTTVLKRHEHFWMLVKVRDTGKSFLGLNARESSALLRALRSIDRLVFPADREVEKLFLEAESFLTGLPRDVERTLLLRACILRILIKVVDSSRRTAARPIPAKLRATIDRIRNNPIEEAPVRDLARQAEMSESHFITAFKYATGMTPNVFRTALRIETAKRLLAETRLRITDVACSAGFSSAAHFATIFRQETGVSPLSWRMRSSGVRSHTDGSS